MTTSAIARLRCRSQRIGADDAADPADVVRHLLAVQAQDLPAAMWALGVRAPGSTRLDVEAALASGAIVRAWPMRGTLHLVPAEDLGWMLELTTARLMAGAAARRAALGLDLAEIERARAVAVRALEGGRELTREGIQQVLEQQGISTAKQRGYHLIWALAQTGTLVWGRMVGSEQVLVLREEWIPRPRRLERDEALGELAARYVVGHGPVTRQDLVRWTGLTVADARRGLSVAGGLIREVELEGGPMWIGRDADLAPPSTGAVRAFTRSVHALPAFDEIVIGYQDRSAVLDPEFEERVVPGKNGVFQPLVLAGGRVVGTWTKQARARGTTCRAVPFTTLSAAQGEGFAAAIAAYGRFLGAAAIVA